MSATLQRRWSRREGDPREPRPQHREHRQANDQAVNDLQKGLFPRGSSSPGMEGTHKSTSQRHSGAFFTMNVHTQEGQFLFPGLPFSKGKAPTEPEIRCQVDWPFTSKSPHPVGHAFLFKS